MPNFSWHNGKISGAAENLIKAESERVKKFERCAENFQLDGKSLSKFKLPARCKLFASVTWWLMAYDRRRPSNDDSIELVAEVKAESNNMTKKKESLSENFYENLSWLRAAVRLDAHTTKKTMMLTVKKKKKVSNIFLKAFHMKNSFAKGRGSCCVSFLGIASNKNLRRVVVNFSLSQRGLTHEEVCVRTS